MCSTKAKRVTQEGGRQGKQDTADGRGREDAQHDGGGRPSMIVEGAPAGRGRGPQQVYGAANSSWGSTRTLRGVSTGKL